MLRFPLLATALALIAGCSITVPVAVVTSRGEVLKGTATADLFKSGTFEASNPRVKCSGTYDALSLTPTVSLAVHCSDGRRGIGRAYRDTDVSGSGKIQLDDGSQAMFVFGDTAAGM